jgi:hypothetical protein
MLARVSRAVLPLIVLLSALLVYRVLVIRPEPPLVFPRQEPVLIAPRYADARVVTDDQLAAVLARVQPPRGPAHTNNYLHALRLWGPAATFDDPEVPSGATLRAYFLDDAVFRRLAGNRTPPLITRDRHGLAVRSYDESAFHQETSSFHTDDVIATLAEIGTPLDAELKLRDGTARVGDLLASALAGYHRSRLEYEWTAIAYARYVFPQRQWRNRYGERIDVDGLVEEILSHPPDVGPCNGLHRLEALVVLYRADEQFSALRPQTKLRMLRYMQAAAQRLVAAQSDEGSWNRQWPAGAAARQVAGPGGAAGATQGKPAPTRYDKLLVTGHHLEWLALAPEGVQPPRETIVRAAQWLVRTLLEMDARDLAEAYGPYTHAARALCLWRGKEAWQVVGRDGRAAADVPARPARMASSALPPPAPKTSLSATTPRGAAALRLATSP